ncbi:MAG: hypothetical protein OEY06_12205 [Gammaproteobacteria bacterium]|nr:hypothetical protein [Gammaproteobacteria bacterium]
MHSNKSTYVIAALYLLVGICLFAFVPRADALYASMYPDWNASQNIFIKAFHYPSYIWILIFGAFTGSIVFLGNITHGKLQKRINIGALCFFVFAVAHIFDWLLSYTFCHSWGCSHILPTWDIFS